MNALHSHDTSTAVPVTVLESSNGAAMNRRRRPRVPGQVAGWLLPVDEQIPDEPWEVRVQDVSRLGVGFVTANPLQTGDVLRIRIGRGPMNLAKKMRVVNCRNGPQEGHSWWVGAEFC